MGEKITIKGCSEHSVFSAGDRTLLKITQVLEKLQEAFSDNNLGKLVYQEMSLMLMGRPRCQWGDVNKNNSAKWLEDGVDCEILTPGGKGWQKVKMKVKVNVEAEFIPDEPEPKKTKPASPLDDLRQKLRDET